MIFACSDLINKFERQTISGIAINPYVRGFQGGTARTTRIHDQISMIQCIEISIMRELFVGSSEFN